MKILVYGSKGWIGNQFIEYLNKKNIKYYLGESRVDNDSSLRYELNTIRPTHIISFIGRTHGKIGNKVYSTIDYLEQEGKLKENIRDNLYSPLLLAQLCKERNIHYTYLGTGCIFDYNNEHPYGKEKNGFTENSKPNFFGSSYSVVKGFTDRLMHLYDNTVLNLRIRMPIVNEDNPRNFITKITKYEYICNVPNSMTVLPDMYPIILDMMKKNVTDTINLTNPGLISHNEILEMYKKYVDPNFTWKNFTIEEQNKILASERSNNFLDTYRLEEMYPNILNIKESVEKVLKNYKKKNLINKIDEPHIDISKYDIVDSLNDDFIDSPDSILLVTGGCGFIGSNFINKIWDSYNKIKLINLDAMYYCANENNVLDRIRNSDRYILVKGNLCSYDLVKHVIETNKVSHIVHFAAQSHVQNSFTDALNYTNDNIVGTHTLLEVNRHNKYLKKFIHVSTDEVYGESMLNIDESKKTEQSILCPTNPYAATKAGAELIAQSYNHSFNMPIVITRGNNVYGPNQFPEKLIPKFIKLLKEDKKVTIQGDGSCVRAFLHSYDTANAFELILKKGKIGEIYNIGCDEGMEFSVLEVAKILIKMIKNTEDYNKWIDYIEDRPFNDKRYYISNKKLRNLGWDIKVKFKDGLTDLIKSEYKLNYVKLSLFNNIDVSKYFGNWYNNVDKLNNKFVNNKPFDHIIIPNFLSDEFANLIYNEYPSDIENWYKYWNPLEVKYAYDNIEKMPLNLNKYFYLVNSEFIVNKISKLSGIKNLEFDPYLHGGGLHCHPKNGRLNMHLDYEKHPRFENKQRRINIILYMSKNWNEKWNGETQLWNKEMTKCIVKSPVKFNTAIIFRTNEISWHGLPDKITCPEGTLRKSIAHYYISPLESKSDSIKFGAGNEGYRKKAAYIKRPNDPHYPQIKKLYDIRPFRRITENDMKEIWPEWNPVDY
jgi:3,5-epimerase/4-reductase